MGILPDWMIQRDVKITPMAKNENRPGKISYGLTSYGYDARIGYKFQVFSPINATVVDPKDFDKRTLVTVDLSPVPHDWGRSFVSMRDARVWDCSACRETVPYVHKDHPPPPGVCPKREQPPDHILIPPHSFVLGETVETFDIPRDCLAVVLGKSTYARCGLVVNVTPLEPEWRGKVTVEISNTTPLPAKVYCGEGIMQILFFRTDGVSEALLNAVRRLCGQRMQDKLRTEKPIVTASEELQTIEELLHTELGNSTCKVSYADKKGKYQDQGGLTPPIVEKEDKQ